MRRDLSMRINVCKIATAQKYPDIYGGHFFWFKAARDCAPSLPDVPARRVPGDIAATVPDDWRRVLPVLAWYGGLYGKVRRLVQGAVLPVPMRRRGSGHHQGE